MLQLAAILAAGLALRADRLDARSYWFDEGFSWKMLSFPWGDMIARVARDNHGPLYFLLAKAWAGALGDSSLSLRALSVLMGEIRIVAMYLLARQAYRVDLGDGPPGAEAERRAERVGILTAALVALSPFQAQWATEVRMYTLGTALTAASGWLLLRALSRPAAGAGPWTAVSVATALLAYTHPYALFSIAAQATFGLGYVAARNRWRPADVRRDRRARALVLSYVAAFALWAPWLPVLLGQRRQVGDSFWLPPMSWWLVGKVAYQMFAPWPPSVPPGWAAGLAAVACAAGFAALLRRAEPGDWFIFLTAAVPVALSAGLSFAQFNIFHRHYFLFAHLSFLAAIAALIARVRTDSARRPAAAAVLAAFLAADGGFARERAARAGVPGARAAAAFLDGRRAPGEPVVVCSLMLTPCLQGHARLRRGWHTYLPPEGYRHYEGTAVAEPGEFLTGADLGGLPPGRIWVVDVERWEKPAHAVPIPPRWSEEGEWRFPEIYGDGCEIIVRSFMAPPDGARRADRAWPSPRGQSERGEARDAGVCDAGWTLAESGAARGPCPRNSSRSPPPRWARSRCPDGYPAGLTNPSYVRGHRHHARRPTRQMGSRIPVSAFSTTRRPMVLDAPVHCCGIGFILMTITADRSVDADTCSRPGDREYPASAWLVECLEEMRVVAGQLGPFESRWAGYPIRLFCITIDNEMLWVDRLRPVGKLGSREVGVIEMVPTDAGRDRTGFRTERPSNCYSAQFPTGRDLSSQVILPGALMQTPPVRHPSNPSQFAPTREPPG